MNRVILPSVLAIGLAFSTGCSDERKAAESTNSMPGKMDTMLSELQATNQQLGETNKKFEKMNRQIDDANVNIKGLDDKMGETNSMVKRQPVLIPFEALLKPEYGRDLSPIPFDLIPFAKEFAKYAGDEELVEVVYIWMKKINEVLLEKEAPSSEEVEAFNHKKMHILIALQAVAGQTPKDKVQRIIESQIFAGGRYQQAALQFLLLRERFLRDVMLEASLFSEPLDTVGKLEQAIEYADSIEDIARLKFVSLINYQITGFMDPIPDMEEKMDPADASRVWKKIKTKAERGIQLELKEWTPDSELNRAIFENQKTRLTEALEVVAKRLKNWEALP